MSRTLAVNDENSRHKRTGRHRLAMLLRQGRRVSDSIDAITMHDLEGRILAWNPGAERLYGYSEQEALRMNVRELIPDERARDLHGIFGAVERGEEIPGVEVKRRAKDGHVVDVWVTTAKVFDTKGRVVAITTTEHDLTERKQSQAAFRRLATVLRDSNDAITMQGLDGQILAWNHGAERMYGYAEHDALRLNMEALVPEEDRQRARGLLRAIARGEHPTSFEVMRKTKDGRVLNVWLTTTTLVDDVGYPIAVATTERDITEQKRLEKETERLLERLGDALKSRDEFLSVASHELKTPITALTLKLHLLLREVGRPHSDIARIATGLEVAARQTQRLTHLVDELLDVSRITARRLKLEREEVNLSLSIQDVLTRLRDVTDRAKCPVLPLVQSGIVGSWDRMRLEQVLENLLTNAAKYGAGSPIEVTLRADGRWATLAVRDHGPGIPESEQGRLFDPFARLAPPGLGGLGLGLFITKQIIDAHHGQIRVDSRQGQGATFVVELPLRSVEPEAQPA
jgi:PAS domain S-box-containing protein